MEPLEKKKGKVKKMEEEVGDRKKLGIWIPDGELWGEFVSKVAKKYGQTYGKVGKELVGAIELWLENEEKVEEEEALEHGDTHTHREKEKIKHKVRGREINDHEVAYGKENGKPVAYPLNSRERRLKAIGRILLGGSGIITLKGLERIIVSQKVGDRRVINDYKNVLEVKGWITRLSKTKYATACDIISNELNIPLVNGHSKIDQVKEERHKTPELNNGANSNGLGH